MKSIAELKEEEDALRKSISELPIEEQKQVYRYLDENLKDADTYAALNYLFICGIHHLYLRKWVRGAINLAIMIIGILLLFMPMFRLIGVVLIIGISLVEIPQLFMSQKIVYQYNNDCIRTALEQAQQKTL